VFILTAFHLPVVVAAWFRDFRVTSGGQRSFSTLCFALALHDMTEAPFEAMDEFDVFMVSGF